MQLYIKQSPTLISFLEKHMIQLAKTLEYIEVSTSPTVVLCILVSMIV